MTTSTPRSINGRRALRWVLALFGICLVVLQLGLAHQGMARVEAANAKPLRVQLSWHPQAQFAGFYVAKDLDLFKREGLAVTLQPGGPHVEPLQQLLNGDTDVAMAWVSDALQSRQRGADIVNVGQLLQRPGTMLVCRADSGVKRPADLRGKRVGSWFVGDQFDLGHWLSRQGLSLADLQLVKQRPAARDLLGGEVDCATAMSYNEFLTILDSGEFKSDLFSMRFDQNGGGALEDGLYVRATDLKDPARRAQLQQLLRGLAAGWRYAARYPEEAVAITRLFMGVSDEHHQRAMLAEVLQLMDLRRGFGRLDPGSFARSVAIVGEGSDQPDAIAQAARGAWSLKIWRGAHIDGPQHGPLGPAGRHAFDRWVNNPWFYGLDLLGTAAFGISGFMQALQRRYDLWGCFILTLLPAVGGGTLRDLLIGGMRSPPFIFKDSTYILVVVAVIASGLFLNHLLKAGATVSPSFILVLGVCDSIGLATFTIIGARVALQSDLGWWWMAICAALTCAGGGMLLDVVTGREPRTFQGEPYEEIAVLGSLVLIASLFIADHFETLAWPVLAAMVVSWWCVFMTRQLVIRHDLRSWRPGHSPALRR